MWWSVTYSGVFGELDSALWGDCWSMWEEGEGKLTLQLPLLLTSLPEVAPSMSEGEEEVKGLIGR